MERMTRRYVIAEIAGGLGNQLFQYAAARSLADRLDLPLLLDCHAYERNQSRRFGLHDFKIRARVMGRLEKLRFGSLSNGYRGTAKWAIAAMCGYAPLKFDVVEEVDHGSVQFPKSQFKSIYMRGYWQNIRYFADNSERISEDLTLLCKPEVEPQLAMKMGHPNSVAVHIRRTDYLTYRYSVCGLSYYQRAIQRLVSLVPDIMFFFFSDDIEWAKQNMDSNLDATFVEPNLERPGQDIWLMAQCRHRILANSSFSWWAAWLARRKDGVVLAPNRWIRGKEGWSPALPNWTLISADA